MEKEFVIRSYGFGELALLYFANSSKKSAATQLGRWIAGNEKLRMNLIENGYKKGSRILTPKQVEVIINHLGKP
jgi:hypothetical protein